MSLTISPNQAAIQDALRNFLLSVLPAGIDAFEGMDNRVGEPAASDFVVFTCIRRRRIATNIDAYLDSAFTASIAGTLMTVTAVRAGANPIQVGATIYGPDVAAGTSVASFGTGTGGIGTYNVTPSQTAPAETMSAGQASFTQQTEVVFQLDVHSANVTDSADMAQTISTMARDPYATQFFAAQNPAITMLLADDPRMAPWTDAEEQYETRWIIEVRLQANQTVSGLSLNFADSATILLVDVPEVYPP